MTAEALPMVKTLGLEPDTLFEAPAPCLSWSGKLNDLQIHLIQNGEQWCKVDSLMVWVGLRHTQLRCAQSGAAVVTGSS